MKKTTFLLLHIVFVSLFTVTSSNATIFFEFDGESGYEGLRMPHPGGGKFTHLGGKVGGQEGTGCSDPGTYHNTILSGEPAAIGASDGSLYSLKTPYSGACPDESFTRDTTIVSLNENKSEIYVRWYQKFTENWNSASVQHKFTKFTPIGSLAMNDNYATAYFKFSSGKNPFQGRIINVEGQFNTADIDRYSVCSIYMTEGGAKGQYSGVNRYWDNYNNKLGPNESDLEFNFIYNVWYSIEIHAKVNSSATQNDAILEMWVDGKKIFYLDNFRFYGPNNNVIPGIGTFEFQHIYYERSNSDQPTYMDNIVIADRYIGPIGQQKALPTPDAPRDFKKE